MVITEEGIGSPTREIGEAVVSFLIEQASVDELRQILARWASWIVEDGEDPIRDVARLALLDIAELEAGHASEHDLRVDLQRWLTGHTGAVAQLPLPPGVRTAVDSVAITLAASATQDDPIPV